MPRPTTELDVKGVSTHNSMLALDGTKKLFCVGCGGPRDVKLAETVPCFCCKSLGTQSTQPVFDEFDELVPAEIVNARREADKQARIERLTAARATKAAAIPAVLVPAVVKLPREAARTSARQPNAQVLPPMKPSARERKQAVTSTLASLF